MEPERLVDLRRRIGLRDPLQAPHPLPRAAHLQPVQRRARRVLPRPRRGAGGAAGLLVGADALVGRPRPGDHRAQRPRDPLAGRAAERRDGVLGRVRRRAGRDLGRRSRDDRALALRTDHGLVVLVDARDLARGPAVHVLHDHRPEDGPPRTRRTGRLRRVRRTARRPAHRPAEDGVRREGRAAQRADDRVCGAPAARAPPAVAGRRGRSARRRAEPRRPPPGARGRRAARGARAVRRAAAARGHPGPAGRGGARRVRPARRPRCRR